MFYFHMQSNQMRQLSEKILIHLDLALIGEVLSLLLPCLTDTTQSPQWCWSLTISVLQLQKTMMPATLHPSKHRVYKCIYVVSVCICMCRHVPKINAEHVLSLRMCHFMICSSKGFHVQKRHNSKDAILIPWWNLQSITDAITSYANIQQEGWTHKRKHSHSTYVHYFVRSELISS